jgi:excisionase family DNA binding protein
MEPQFLTIPQACDRWSMGRTKVYELVTRGKIIARKCGSRTLVEVKSGDEYFNSLPQIKSQ